MEIGARLKEAREANQITLDNLQETTKIQKRYLLAIEQENFHLLPGKFYARAFIKEYATAVGLDPDELLASYKEVSMPDDEENNEMQHSRIHRSRQEDRASRNPVILSIAPKIIVGLLIIGIIFAALYFYQKQTSNEDPEKVEQQDSDEIIRSKQDEQREQEDENNRDENPENEEDKEDENKEDEKTEEEETEPELKLVETGEGNRPESTFELNHPDEEITLTFKPTGVSWIDVKNEDNETLLGANTAANTPIDLEVTDQTRIRVNIGNITELPVITINDIEIEYPTDSMTQSFWIDINRSSE